MDFAQFAWLRHWADGFVTLDIVQQVLRVDHRGGTDGRGLENLFRVTPDHRCGELFSTVLNP